MDQDASEQERAEANQSSVNGLSVRKFTSGSRTLKVGLDSDFLRFCLLRNITTEVIMLCSYFKPKIEESVDMLCPHRPHYIHVLRLLLLLLLLLIQSLDIFTDYDG